MPGPTCPSKSHAAMYSASAALGVRPPIDVGTLRSLVRVRALQASSLVPHRTYVVISLLSNPPHHRQKTTVSLYVRSPNCIAIGTYSLPGVVSS